MLDYQFNSTTVLVFGIAAWTLPWPLIFAGLAIWFGIVERPAAPEHALYDIGAALGIARIVLMVFISLLWGI